MKVYLGASPESQIGGINRVLASLHTYLPDHGIEIVDSADQADVIHEHVSLYHEYPVEIPLVVSSHGLLWEEDGWAKVGWKVNRTCVDSYIAADSVTAPSNFVAKAIERNTLVVPRVVRHGINTDEWTPQESYGHVLWNKGRVDAACRVDDLVYLVGAAPEISFVSTFGINAPNLEITGKLKLEDMKRLVQHAGVYLITPRESGGPSFGVLEALSCGVPVLSWNYGGTAEAVVHEETGYLAEPGNRKDLLAGLHYCIEHRQRLSENARESALQYDIRKNVVQYIEVYEDALRPATTKVSVIIPCHNLGKFLPDCIKSVQEQSYKDWEIIVVDDASTDDSFAVAQTFKSDKIKVFRNPHNLHVSATRNRAVKLSQGQYILPLDADDRLAPDALANMVSVLDQTRKYQIVSGKLKIFPENDPGTSWQGEWPNNTDYNLQITGYNRLHYSSMYRRKVWENLGGYRSRIKSGVEDADFWTRALSFGYRPTILDDVTLLYTHRSNSLGKQNQRGTDAWLPWFGWAINPKITPVAATGKGPYNTISFDSPEVSVVVPVGPGHEKYIQTITDSMLAQTFNNWELVLVNDTGQPWEEYIPFATVIETGGKGVAAARNAGVKAAKAGKVVFLDADDVAQSKMLSVLVKTHAYAGGWVYGDWYYTTGKEIHREFSKDWDARELLQKSLGPITGLYEKEHVLAVGGFDESAPGWEDWDFHLKLLEQGICGTRVEYPLIMYNMHLGSRREENFINKKDLIQYIVDKHDKLYRSGTVGCSKCGGKKTVSVVASVSSAGSESVDTKMIKLIYEGPETQYRTLRSQSNRGMRWRYKNGSIIQVPKEDAARIITIKHWSVYQEEVPTVGIAEAPLVTDEKAPSSPETSLDVLELRPEVIAVLKDHFSTLEGLRDATDAQLLSIKGVGPGRLEQIKAALHG